MWPFTKHPPGTVRCSFCNKHQNDVRKLIAGPGVYICDECIALCNDIIAEELGEREEAQRNEEAGSGAALLGLSLACKAEGEPPGPLSLLRATSAARASCRGAGSRLALRCMLRRHPRRVGTGFEGLSVRPRAASPKSSPSSVSTGHRRTSLK